MFSQKNITLVIGGCRSGKSNYALQLSEDFNLLKKKFLATSLILDEEMENRVAKHRQDRGREWETIESPLDLPAVLSREFEEDSVLLVDCLSMWINNMLLKEWSEEKIDQEFISFKNALSSVKSPLVLISNEVGTGIVPESRLSRKFRDYVGKLNQEAAACADRVICMVAGIPVKIK